MRCADDGPLGSLSRRLEALINARGRTLSTPGFVSRVALGIAIAATAQACAAAETWTLDPSRSHAGFAVKHLVFATVHGTVPVQGGRMTTASTAGPPVAFETTLDPEGIDTGNGDRDGSLRGSDYFDVATYPTWTFVSTSVEPGKSLTIHGMLTIHGVAQSVTLAARELAPVGNARHFTATTTVDRHGFRMAHTSADGLIGNDVHIISTSSTSQPNNGALIRT